MKFEFIGNACGIFTSNSGIKLLCDPWLVDGIFEGSWFHYPPVKTTYEDLKVGGIYVSHIHPDHFDTRHFGRLDKKLPIFILHSVYNFLELKLKQLGFHNLVSIKNEETYIFHDMELTMFSPFSKNPHYECKVGSIIDSALVVKSGKYLVFNANDNVPSKSSCVSLVDRFGTFDLAMLNYNVASLYPACFDNLSPLEKISEYKRIKFRELNHMVELTNILKPRAVLPFAGSYVLGGKEYLKDEFGPFVVDEAADYLANKTDSKIIIMNENQEFDCESLSLNTPYVPIDKEAMNYYINNTLSKIKYPYENDEFPEKTSLLKAIERASNAMIKRMDYYGIQSSYEVSLEVYDLLLRIYPNFCESITSAKNILKCKMDERLLYRITRKEAYWNNAEYGSHITFFRDPNIYEPDLHVGLQFFHL